MSRTPKSFDLDEVVERAAQAVNKRRRIRRATKHEPALQAMCRALGQKAACEDDMREFARAVLDEVDLVGLADSRIELLGSYKLDYPQDYDPDDVEAMHAEIRRLTDMLEHLR